MHEVELSPRAQRLLTKLDATIQARIEKRLMRLKQTPVPSDAKCIGRQDNDNIFRYRIGRYRVLYTINPGQRLIIVHKIEKRSRVYQP